MHYKLYIVLQILLEEIDECAAQVLAGAGAFALLPSKQRSVYGHPHGSTAMDKKVGQ